MSEQINVVEDNGPARILLRAISLFVKDPNFSTKFGKGPVCDIKLTINGVEVPVAETFESIWNSFTKETESEARKMAIKMVTEAGLDPLAEVLREAEVRIREKLGIWDDR